MIHCLTGEIIHIDPIECTAVIDCAGVGYKVTVSANTLPRLGAAEGKKTRIYTYMQVYLQGKDDVVELFGFGDTKELEAFKLLKSVSGVGPSAALAILSALTPEALSVAISTEDSKAISRAKGVGSKIAARIVLELKDKFVKAFPVSDKEAGNVITSRKAAPIPSSKLADARDALVVLGFSASEASKALGAIDPSGEVEDLIRKALAYLAG